MNLSLSVSACPSLHTPHSTLHTLSERGTPTTHSHTVDSNPLLKVNLPREIDFQVMIDTIVVRLHADFRGHERSVVHRVSEGTWVCRPRWLISPSLSVPAPASTLYTPHSTLYTPHNRAWSTSRARPVSRAPSRSWSMMSACLPGGGRQVMRYYQSLWGNDELVMTYHQLVMRYRPLCLPACRRERASAQARERRESE